jgi:hypothetical protein
MIALMARGRARPGVWAAIGVPWLAGYGTLQAYWRLGGRPAEMSPVGDDLVLFQGWGIVALCALGAALLGALASSRVADAAGRVLVPAAWVTAVAMAGAAAMLVLDVVGAILPGLGLSLFPVGAASRALCLGGGVLVGLGALARRRADQAGCAGCRRSPAWTRLDHVPGWAFAAAYAAVAGCATRVAAQAAVGFGENPLSSGVSAVLFEIGFLLGGSLLPLALVHSWGRVWPRWVPVLAGRAVPRRLVLWPATGISGGLTVYFGVMLVQMIGERSRGRNPFPATGGLDLPEAFFWVAVPSYLLWGAGMAVAAYGYARLTRRACERCGRGGPPAAERTLLADRRLW